MSIAENTIFKNPIMIASGNFGYDGFGTGEEHYPLDHIGGVVMKTLTRYPLHGNIEPCQFPEKFKIGLEEHQPLLNSYGLNNPGIDFASTYLFAEWRRLNVDVIISILAENEEYLEHISKIIGNTSYFKAIEVNLSCPNIEDVDLTYHELDSIIDTIKKYSSLPIWIKLAPNIFDIIPVAEAALDSGASALTIANTIPALHIDIKTGKSVLGNIYGGMSGPALKPINMALVHQIKNSVDIPIIGVGGITSGEDVMEYIMAGASAVQIGSANRADFYAPDRILNEYNALKYNVDC